MYIICSLVCILTQDDEISKDEWYKMWSDCADKVVGNQEFPYWLSSYMSFMFDAADTSGTYVLTFMCKNLPFY